MHLGDAYEGSTYADIWQQKMHFKRYLEPSTFKTDCLLPHLVAAASLTCMGTSCQEPTTKNFSLRWPEKVSLWKVRPRDRHKAEWESPHQSCKRRILPERYSHKSPSEREKHFRILKSILCLISSPAERRQQAETAPLLQVLLVRRRKGLPWHTISAPSISRLLWLWFRHWRLSAGHARRYSFLPFLLQLSLSMLKPARKYISRHYTNCLARFRRVGRLPAEKSISVSPLLLLQSHQTRTQ